MAPKNVQLVDQFGRPIQAHYRFYQGGDPWRDGDRVEWGWWTGDRDIDELLDTTTWRNLLSAGRFLFANEPLVRGAILEMATFSFPINPQYKGADKAWASRYGEPWLHDWRANKTFRGPAFDADTCAYLRLIGRKIDGDTGRLLAIDKDGLPKVQYIRAHRIGNRTSRDKVEAGRYRGKRICNGVILSDQGSPIAYRLLGRKKEEDQDLPAPAFNLCYNPESFDQCRGHSELLASIPPFSGIKRLRQYEMRAQQMFAALCLLEETESGGMDGPRQALGTPSESANTQGTPSGLYTRAYSKGMHLYFKALSGAGLKAFRADRPSRDSQEWEDKMVASAIYGAGWDPNFALMLEQPGGALARVMIEKVRRTIQLNQKIEARAQRQEDVWALSVAVNTGLIPPPNDGNLRAWDYVGPPRLSADNGNEERIRIDKYLNGALTLREWMAEAGRDWEEHRQQRHRETSNLAAHARELASEFPEMSFAEWLYWLEKRDKVGSDKSAAGDLEDEDPIPPPRRRGNNGHSDPEDRLRLTGNGQRRANLV